MKCSIALLLVVIVLVCGGCVFHTQTSVGMGKAAQYVPSTAAHRGLGVDYGPDAQYSVEKKFSARD